MDAHLTQSRHMTGVLLGAGQPSWYMTCTVSAVILLKFLVFEQGTLHFSPDPENYVSHPGQGHRVDGTYRVQTLARSGRKQPWLQMRNLDEPAAVEKHDLTSLESALQSSYKDASDTPSRVGGNAYHSQKSSNKLDSDVEAFTHISMFSPHNNPKIRALYISVSDEDSEVQEDDLY